MINSRDSDSVVQASQAAISRAKRRGERQVEPDDLLIGVLQTAARFGVVDVGPWIIDVDALDATDGAERPRGPRVAYGDGAVRVFDRASAIARQDGATTVDLVHLLVAFAEEEDGLMGSIRADLGFTSAEWRAALARWAPAGAPQNAGSNGAASDDLDSKSFLSPDEASQLMGLHTQTIRGYIKAGKLPAHRLAGERALRIRKQDLVALLRPYSPKTKPKQGGE